MKMKNLDPLKEAETVRRISWSEKYSVGIKLIDAQHMELVNLTNELYKSLYAANVEEKCKKFEEAIHSLVKYVRHHFSAELELLKKIQFPDIQNHKIQHEQLIKNILEAQKTFSQGKHLVLNKFARTLEEWIFGHIGIYDQAYALFIKNQKKNNLLTDSDLIL